MYEELVKRLKIAAEWADKGFVIDPSIHYEAADAIEKLQEDSVPIDDMEMILSEVAKPRWIPVTKRLPEDNEAVNVVWVNHNPVFYYQQIKDKPQMATGVYYRGKWYWWSAVVQDYLAEYGKWEPDLMDAAIEVTHWMPLPEPPKEET